VKNTKHRIMGLAAFTLVACSDAHQFAQDIAEDAGEMLQDAGEMLADAGSALADAGALVDSSAQAMQGDGSRPQGDAAQDSALPADGSLPDGSQPQPGSPRVLTLTANCDQQYGTRSSQFVDELAFYAETVAMNVAARDVLSVTAMMCDREVISSMNDPEACVAPACNTNGKAPAPATPTCVAAERIELEQIGTRVNVRVKCGFRKRNPGVFDYGHLFQHVRVTLVLP